MEREKQQKREREGDDEEYQEHSWKKINAKKQDSSSSKKDIIKDSDEKLALDIDIDLDVGVFDFPWLKDGMISKSEEWRFEDAFSSSLYDTDHFPAPAQCLCHTSDPEPALDLLDFPQDNKSDDNLRRPHPHEDDGLDCIWTSLLSQPLQQAGGGRT